ncbi:hypothetical protein [Pedobacter punctiformis]|uniref:Uncharacterized protein n=1 Tax=Pedobacter punctiformis TaxID=3004097 RepID=A0ABT4L6M1_9SPHI|nr:hypothetical protein [Pedobacter sp. HCMS5-2]MCZ4243570.1 hypothetical protein [Pedobacter sp. HCMS5-2]
MIVSANLPTSALLEVKVKDKISDEKGTSGVVKAIQIQETDEYLLFLFALADDKIISVRKIKNIC